MSYPMSEDIKTAITAILNELWGCGLGAGHDTVTRFERERMREEHIDDALNQISAVLSASASPKPDMDAAKRLRLLCNMLGLKHGVPDDDAMLMQCQFAVFGVMRAALEASASDKKESETFNDLAKDVLNVLNSFDYAADEDSATGASYFNARINEDWFFYVKHRVERAAIAANAGKDKDGGS
jgi:hypothetical protein